MTAGGTRMVEIESCDGSVGSLKSKLDAVSVEERDSLGQDEKTTDTEQSGKEEQKPVHIPDNTDDLVSECIKVEQAMDSIILQHCVAQVGP